MRSLLPLPFLAAAILVARTAAADGSVDRPVPDDDAARHAIDRTWLYLDDARVPAPLTVVGMSNATYTSVGSSPSRIYSPYRQFAANTAQPGVMAAVGGEVGLLPHLSIMALGQMGFGGEGPGPSAGAIAGVRFSVLPQSMTNTHLVLSGGYVREAWAAPVHSDAGGDADTGGGTWLPAQPHGDDGAWVQAAFAQDIQRLRVGTTVHAEHVFSQGRDGVDMMVQVGASYRVVGPLRAGVEYVGQDLEEALNPEAEGGARHFIGPTASVQLLGDRLTMVAGPSIGLSQFSPAFVGRFGLAYGF
jgi:hypothetical protein